MSRGTKAPFKSYEGKKQKDKHIRLTKNMLDNENFKSLKASSIVLYLYMKMWASGEEEFNYAISLGENIMSRKTVISSIKELIQKGFIEKTAIYNKSHKPNTYRFSNKWQYK